MRHSQHQFGQLTCHLLHPTDTPPRRVAVFCHGYGANAHDLMALATPLTAALGAAADHTAFIFPEAPLALPPPYTAARAWWPIDMAGLANPGAAAQRLQQMQQEAPPGAAHARRLLREALEAALHNLSLGYGDLILGGFSQGAMLACDVALRLDEPPAALALLSGCLVDEPSVRRLAPRRRGLRVLQTHGYQDPILPHAQAEALCNILQASGLAVDFLGFAGGHTIPAAALQRLALLFEP